MLRVAALAALLSAAACKSESGADPAEIETPSAPAKGSAGGFSATLSADIGGTKPGAGSSTASGSAAGGSAAGGSAAGSAMAGSDAAGGGGSGAGASASGAGSAAVASTPDTSTPAGSAATPDTSTPAGSAATPEKSTTTAGSAATPDKSTTSAAGSAAKTPASTGTTPAGTGTAPAGAGTMAAGSAAPPVKPTTTAPAGAGSGAKPVVSAALAAIKLSLLANWDRDQVEAGTISLYEKNTRALFKFNYGYEDAKAPTDREAYKKFLGTSGALTVKLDRQSGAAWYLEGTDAQGRPAFRVLVTYGGQRLICGGSLYKDAQVDRDLRDSILIQAKQICESIQL